uniref:MAPK regulated corepressor interacting protein 1 n=1 Tax=Chrysemys picta bellii TaxID=8478 RepID=A0A8C3FWU8_CHRPI
MRQHLLKLNIFISAHPDNLHTKGLKGTAEDLAEPLINIKMHFLGETEAPLQYSEETLRTVPLLTDIQELRLDDLMVSSGLKLYETVKFPGVCRGTGFLRAGIRAWEQLEGALGVSHSKHSTLPSLSRCAPSPAWQCVERDLRNQMSGSERGLVEEYVEKIPNPSLKAFKPVDLSDLKRRNTQDAKKS